MLKRKIIGAVLTLVLLLSFVSFTAQAATRVDTNAPSSLTLTHGYDGQGFAEVSVRIHQVATISEFSEYTLTGAFSELPVEINTIRTQEEWNQVASTLSAFVVSESIAPGWEAVTGEDGTVHFANLPQGLYLVEYVRVEYENSYYHFDSFVISVPSLDDQDQWVYDVVAKPKSVYREILPDPITYTVNKLWKDEGHQHLRPQSVSIDLYRDGEFVETVVLSAENNWTYSWTTRDDGAIWQAVETDVPDGYKVTLEQKGNYFYVTNSYNVPVPPPQTGDTANMQLYLILMCAAGLGLIVLGLTSRRGRQV